jgi:pimeloyl-ACP methyl ester carboxylesterase
MPFTQAGGIRIAYDVEGKGDAVVFLHDHGSTRASWAATLQAFGRDFRAIALDLRGHGGSDVPDAASPTGLAGYALDVNAVLDAERAPRAHLVGVGLGAEAALRFAHDFPARVRSVTVAGPLSAELETQCARLPMPTHITTEPAGTEAFNQALRAFWASSAQG